jgi:hypothetical protein
MTNKSDGFTHIGDAIGEILKEGLRRAELRSRLEAELGRPLTDKEFITIADAIGRI